MGAISRVLAFLLVGLVCSCAGDAEPTATSGDTSGSVTTPVVSEPVETPFSLMTYNMLVGTDPAHVAEVVAAADPDVAVIQEAALAADALAVELELEGVEVGQGSRPVLVFSRLPITEVLDGGVRVELCAGTEVAVFGVHLQPYPYEPYDLRDDPDLTEAQLIESAVATRGAEVDAVLDELAPLVGEIPVFLGGDFNEPSHLDWTPEAAATGLHLSRAVAWPSSTAVREQGLIDSYRMIEPDPVAAPGDTWTPQPGDDEVHDRIDHLYASKDVTVESVVIVGEDDETSDLVVDPYLSDHRAVLASYSVPSSCAGDGS